MQPLLDPVARFVRLREGFAATQHRMLHDNRPECRYVASLLGEIILTTFFYVLACWLLFNGVFALAMYFRPVRKPSVDSNGHHGSEAGSPASPRLSSAAEESFDKDTGRSAPGSLERSSRPSMLSRILFFGFWLNDGRHSA
jgi:hypothetical protein